MVSSEINVALSLGLVMSLNEQRILRHHEMRRHARFTSPDTVQRDRSLPEA